MGSPAAFSIARLPSKPRSAASATRIASSWCTDAEGYELMRDRFCAHMGSGIELWDVADVPRDRWFRDARVRSHNGGPISISLPKAKAVQFRQIKRLVDRENTRRLEEIDLLEGTVEPDWGAIRDQFGERTMSTICVASGRANCVAAPRLTERTRRCR
jgi:hypothetical protein